MSRLHISTRGIGSWRERLADPGLHWKRRYSAFETAVSWELAAARESGLPAPIEALFQTGGYDHPCLMLAVAEHKVELAGRGKESQCDVWGLVHTSLGVVSLAVEAKAQEPFGDEPLSKWLAAGKSERAGANRKVRWDHIRSHLPTAAEGAYQDVPYQLLHRCATAVIEARRCRLGHAALVVQAFGSHPERYAEFAAFCATVRITASRNAFSAARVGDVRLALGWADCSFATDSQVAATA